MKRLLLILFLFPWSALSQQHGFVREFDTVDQLIAATNNPNTLHKVYFLKGFNAINDSQGGLIYWNPGDNTPTNSNDILASLYPGAVGRFRWLTMGHVVPPPFSGGVTNYTAITVPTIADLKNVSITNGIQFVDVQGYSTPGDRGQGIFIWDASSVAPDDGGRVIQANNNPTGIGAWIRQIPSPLQGYATEWWGAVLTGTNINNGPISAAINYVNSIGGGTVILPPVDTTIDATQPIFILSNVEVQGQKGSVIRVADNPSTNYLCFIFADVTNAALRNVSMIGWNASPPGAPGNVGYGVYLTNSSKITLGGILYNSDFYTAPIFIEPSCSDISVYDDRWIKNSVKGYGAIGNNVNNDTEAFKLAIQNMNPQVGDRVVVPPGSYAINLWITNTAGLVMEALNQGGQGLTNFILTPFNPTLPVLRMGTNTWTNGYPNRSLTFRGLMFDGRGPFFNLANNATWGQIGLSIQGGTESAYFDNCEWQAFTGHAVELIGSSTDGASVENITFNNPNIQVSLDTATNTTVGFYARYRWATNSLGGDVTKVTILSGKMNGNNLYGYIMGLEGVKIEMMGTYLDGYGGHLVYMDTHTNNAVAPPLPIYYPHVHAFHVVMDKHGGSNVAVEDRYTGSFPWSFSGTIDTSGTFLWNGVEYPNYYFMTEGFPNAIYSPTIMGNAKFTVPGDYFEGPNTLALDSSTNFLFSSTNGFRLQHRSFGSVQVEANTNAAIASRELVVVSEVFTVTITNIPVDSIDTFTINDHVRSWVNVVTDVTNQVAISGTVNGCAVALYNHIVVYPYTNLLSSASVLNNVVTLTGGPGSHLTNMSIGSYVSVTTNYITNYSTFTFLQHGGVSSIIPGGDLHLDNAIANAVVTVKSNAESSAITITSTGIGLASQTSPNHPVSVGFNGGLANTAEMSVGYRVTNYTGSHVALDVETEANPVTPTDGSATNVAANYFGIYSVARTTGANTNNFIGSPTLGNRFETRHDAAMGINEVDALIVGPNTTNSGAGWITNSVGLHILDQIRGKTNWALLSGLGRHAYGGGLEYNNAQTFTVIASDQLQPTQTRLNVGPASGNVILTNVPTILPGYDGQVIFLTSVSSNTVEFIDKGVFGWVTSITVSGGSNYAAPPAVDFSLGGGTSAAGTAEISAGGVVTNIIITNPGDANYVQNFPLILTGGGGSNTTAGAYVSTTGLYLGGSTNVVLSYGDTKIFVYNPTIGLWCLVK